MDYNKCIKQARTHTHTQKHATHLSFVFKYFIQKKPKAHLQNFKPSVSMFLEWRTVPSPHRDRRYGSNNSPVRLGGVWVEQIYHQCTKRTNFKQPARLRKSYLPIFFFFFYAHTSGKWQPLIITLFNVVFPAMNSEVLL